MVTEELQRVAKSCKRVATPHFVTWLVSRVYEQELQELQIEFRKLVNVDDYWRVAKIAQELQRVAKELQIKKSVKLVVSRVYE